MYEINQPQYFEDQSKIHYQRALEYKNAGRLEEALRECGKALDIDSIMPEALNLRGVILEELGNIEEAIQSYKKAIHFEPSFKEAVTNLAELESRLRPNPQLYKTKSELVTIATFTYPNEAYVQKAKLEFAGIFAFLADDYVATMNWLYTTAIGGVKLQVREEDIEKAISILEYTTDKHDFIDKELVISPDHPRCPNCRSTNTSYQTFEPRLLFLSWLLLEFPLPFFKRKWKCNGCGYSWKLD